MQERVGKPAGFPVEELSDASKAKHRDSRTVGSRNEDAMGASLWRLHFSVYNYRVFNHPFFILLFFILVLVSILHNIGVSLFWYARFSSWDLLVHFLGGFWVSGLTLWALFLRNPQENKAEKSSAKLFWIPLLALFVVGTSWEIFEFIIREPLNFVSKEVYITDTVADFLANISGAVGVSWYFIRKKYDRATEVSPQLK